MRRVLLGLYSYFEFFLCAVLFLLPLSIVTLATRGDPTRRLRGRWMRRFGSVTSGLTPLWRFGFDGAVPADILRRGYVVVSNHESTSDPFLLCKLPWDMRWVAKEEIFRLPLIGWLMKLSGDIALRRGSKESVERMMEECRRTLISDQPVMIFPEGTRSPDGALLPFKDGAFQLAIDTQKPILPLALAGTRQCRPKGSRWFGDARAVVRILAPIETSGLTRADLPNLREEVRRRIDLAARQLRTELRLPQPAEPTVDVDPPTRSSPTEPRVHS